MSVVDQQVQLAVGRVGRLLLRAVLALGGAFAVMAIGWVLWAAPANAGELPSVPSVPSVVAGVDNTVARVSTQDAVVPVLPSNPLSDKLLPATALPTNTLPTNTLPKNTLPTSTLPTSTLPDTGLVKVAHQVSLPVAEADRVAPVVVPIVSAQPAGQQARRSPVPAAIAVPVRAVTTEALRYNHIFGQATERTAVRTASPAPSGARRHAPVLPPSQPAGSPDSSAHGTTDFPGGAGGPQAPVHHVLGAGIDLAGTPSTPRSSVVPGKQPGTSPD